MCGEVARARRSGRGRVIGALACLGLTLASAPCRAQSGAELSAARQTFVEGKDFEKRGAWDEALLRFKAVARVKMTPQVRFHIALCEENLGRLVSAMRGFELAAEEARQAGATAVEVAEKAPERVAALKKRVGTVTVHVNGKLIDSSVTLDGVPLLPSSFDAAIPVDPGAHVVLVLSAEGKGSSRTEVTVAEHGEAQVTVTVADALFSPPKPKPLEPKPEKGSRLPAYLVGSVGLAALAGSAVFYGLEVVTINTLRREARCDAQDHGCDPAYQSLGDTGRVYSVVSPIALGVGVAGLATAGVLWFTLGPNRSSQRPPALAISPHGRGLAIRGAF
jgi:hypothetical protein